MKPVRKAVFPVGGMGTRFLPATKAVPKEMLPVVDKPLLQYAVDEALAAGIEQMIFVTARGKSALEDYFDVAGELVMTLREKGKTAELAVLEGTQLAPGNIAYVRQQEPAGLGHAVWCARHITGDEPFAVLLPDELLWQPDYPCLKQMVDARNKVGGTVIAVMEVPEEETHRYGIVAPGAVDGALTEVRGFVEKPRAGTAPSRLAAVGRYLIEPQVMDILAEGKRGAGGEIQLTDALAQLIGKSPFHAYTYAGARFDCGDKAGHITANLALALERPDIGPAVRAWMTTNL
ncbi:UTP--glucose-1-phosphate uridylyltransferase [Sandaracinobacteroides saxicola]|uniref:UTP--glucose-1-phosphate uridylyltransferase n=1 Tax=Sandaracinobacteroides saxicola TaxID=2759707 RepID=A0A7G5IIU7_9SPHN|nr:UTP--glucose-1-phosphate uridylyltransferase [Sandaracinobacteroides saxicola]QMW23289.1 UTP--glucose-1-phosphate uridylyltransferase [Sandaracinobacteroides saxicola]